MACFYGGVAPGQPRQLWAVDICTAGSAQTISITVGLEFQVRMLQLTAHWGAVPALTGDLVLGKTSGYNFRLSGTYRSVDPSSATGQSLTDFVCVTPFIWKKFDDVTVTYANPSDIDVGVEIFLEEVLGIY